MGKDLLIHVGLLVLFGLIPALGFPETFHAQTIGYGLLVIALLHIPVYIFTAKKIDDPNPNTLIRTVMAGTMIKFLLSIVAVGIWLYSTGAVIHKPDLYWLMGVYFFFTLFDAVMLSKTVRGKGGKA
ncbi:MAG: hypothetical protein FGM54_09565 [Chitinophagaceae bacterium]|nr:hypothetical protein [Chitinophagaceae bacterium]